MKINDLIENFEIFVSNEEQKLLDSLEGVKSIEYFNEREQVVIENLVRKSLVSKVRNKHYYMVRRNDS
jgi:hypothetical protein